MTTQIIPRYTLNNQLIDITKPAVTTITPEGTTYQSYMGSGTAYGIRAGKTETSQLAQIINQGKGTVTYTGQQGIYEMSSSTGRPENLVMSIGQGQIKYIQSSPKGISISTNQPYMTETGEYIGINFPDTTIPSYSTSGFKFLYEGGKLISPQSNIQTSPTCSPT